MPLSNKDYGAKDNHINILQDQTMGYQTTQFLYFFRKLSRTEDKKGSFKKIFAAVFLAMILVIGWNQVEFGQKRIKDIEEVEMLKAFFSLRGDLAPPSNIAIVKVNDASYQKLNVSTRKAFPRDIFASALEEIQKDKPKLIILDAKGAYEKGLEVETQKLADALKLGPATVVKVNTDKADVTYRSDPIIVDAAAMELDLSMDSFNGNTYYIQRAHQIDSDVDSAFPLLKPLKTFVDPNLEVPKKNSLINFYGKDDTITGYPIWQLFSEKRLIPKGFFSDKIVFVGFSTDIAMRGISDKELISVTARGNRLYGVEVHANIAANLLNKNWITRGSDVFETLFLLFSLCILILAIFYLEPASATIFLGLYFSIWGIATYCLLAYWNFFLPGLFLTLFAIPFIFAGVTCTVASLVLKELRETKKMLGIKV